MPHFRRRSPRIVGYDYGEPASYFVTICLLDRRDLFGSIDSDGRLTRSSAGPVIARTWSQIPTLFSDVALDSFVVMPDHLHGIVFVGIDPDSDRRTSLIDIARWFKSVSTTRYSQGAIQGIWPGFDRHLWQRSFHDRIIRNDTELDAFRSYIDSNPLRWAEKRRNT